MNSDIHSHYRALVILPYYSDNKLTFQRFTYMDWKNDQSFTSNLTLKQLSIILRFITQIDLGWIESPISYCAIFWTIWYLKISTVAILYISLHWIEKRLLHLIIAHYETGLLAWISIWHHSTRSLQWELQTSPKVCSCPSLAKEQTTFIHSH